MGFEVEEVALGGIGEGGGAGGELENGAGAEVEAGDAPRRDARGDGDDAVVAVEGEDVDGKAHAEGVDALGRVEPKAFAGFKGQGFVAEQAAGARKEAGGGEHAGAEELAGSLDVDGVDSRRGDAGSPFRPA